FSRASVNSARQPLLTHTEPLLLPQLRPSMHWALDSCRTSVARRQPVLQTRWRLSLLSQRIVPALPFQLPFELPRPSANSARQPLLTHTEPLPLPQLRPSMHCVLDSCRTSVARRQPVLQTRWRLSLLSQRIVPGLPFPFQLPPPLPRSEVAMSCLMREKPQPELTWSR